MRPPGQRAVGIGIKSSEILSISKLSSFLIIFISGNWISIKFSKVGFF